jgi:hypothetical protein
MWHFTVGRWTMFFPSKKSGMRMPSGKIRGRTCIRAFGRYSIQRMSSSRKLYRTGTSYFRKMGR